MANMTLNLKKGAVICVEVDTGSLYAGKVKELTASTIVLIDQIYVGSHDRVGSNIHLDIDGTISIDSKDLTFVNRERIVAWWYDTHSLHDDDELNVNWIRHDEISDDDIINAYDEDGFCKGEGDFLEK